MSATSLAMRRTRASSSTSASSASTRTPQPKKPKKRRRQTLFGGERKRKRRRAGKDTPQAQLEQRCAKPGECVRCLKPAVLCSQCKLTKAVSSKYPAVPLPPLRHHPRGCLGFPPSTRFGSISVTYVFSVVTYKISFCKIFKQITSSPYDARTISPRGCHEERP